MTVEEHLSSIDTSLALLDQRLASHTEADEDNFLRITAQLNTIETKLDHLRLADAARVSAIDTNKRNASMLGGGVAAGIVAIFEGIKYIVGR